MTRIITIASGLAGCGRSHLAINLAAESFGLEPRDGMDPVVLTTSLEHSSNDLPWRRVPGATQIRLTTDDEGFIGLEALEALLKAYNEEGRHGKGRIRLVTMSGASNVLGTYNPIEEISRIAHRYDARLLVDGAQLVAHRPVSMERMGIDYLAFSAHTVHRFQVIFVPHIGLCPREHSGFVERKPHAVSAQQESPAHPVAICRSHVPLRADDVSKVTNDHLFILLTADSLTFSDRSISGWYYK